jgi:hypothetical protein
LSQKYRSKQNRSGDLDQTKCFILVVNARQVDNNRVTLPNDLGLGDSERVNTLTNTLNSKIETDGVVLANWFLSNRNSALQVEAECRRVVSNEVASERTEYND